MRKPLLQIALDTLTIDEALANVEQVKAEIDVIEVGTILISSVGKQAISIIAKQYPNKIIVADGKIADAGAVFGEMFFSNGTTYTTVICAAETSTMRATLNVAKKYGKDKEVQVELTSHYSDVQVQEWKAIGITQVVYHCSRDAQASGVTWTKKDLLAIKKLVAIGFKVTVAGGITIADIKFFQDIPIYIFIVGRSITTAINPQQVAQQFKEEIAKYW